MRIFETVISLIFWVRIALSPIIGGTILAAVFFFGLETLLGNFLAIISLIAGLTGGILLAESARKSHGTAEFASRVMATPELDNLEDDKRKAISYNIFTPPLPSHTRPV